MARTIGKAFKIAAKDVKSYGYVHANKRGQHARNGGVTAIAAINGRGSYLRNRQQQPSTRSVLEPLPRRERVARARQLTGADRAAFARRLGAASSTPGVSMRTNSTSQIAAARRNIRRALAARGGRLAANKRRAPRRLTRNTWEGEVRRHAAAAHRGHGQPGFPSTAGTAESRRGKKKVKATKAKKSTKRSKKKGTMRTNARHRRNFSAKRRAAALRNLKKARRAAGLKPNRARKAKALRRNPKRRTARKAHRANASAKPRASALRNLRKARAARKTLKANRKRSRKAHRRNAKRRTHRRNFSAKRRATALRNLRKARAARKAHRPNRRRKTSRKAHRRNGLVSNRRRKTSRKAHRRNGLVSNRRRKTSRKAHRRNGRRAFRRNSFLATMKGMLQVGAIATAGFVGHKLVTKFVTEQVIDRILGAAPAAVPATSGLMDAVRPFRSVLGGAAVALGGMYAVDKFVPDARTKMFLTAGMATSLVTSLAVVVLNKFAPRYAGVLAGHDGTAASISAMYGLGAGASIMPEYHPIGEYFAQNGLGEYFAQHGLGAYGSNPDLMQAAAGYGTVENTNSNIVDPGSDLDAQLSIAEAAAGVGAVPYEAAAGYGRVQPFEAAAGIGEYFAQNGLGAVVSVPPRADTWIPGTSDGQLWAGTRAITQPQSRDEMVTAGVLETRGNQGVFG